MRQDSRSVLDYWIGLRIRNSEPEGLVHLRHIASALKEKDPKSAKWLKQALTDIESGADPQKALSLTRKRGRPSTSNKDLWEQIAVGARVNQLRDDGWSYEKAVGQVADELHLSDSSVKRYYNKYRDAEKAFPFRQFENALGGLSQGMDALVTGIRQTLESSGLTKFLCDLEKTLAGAAEQLGRSEFGRALTTYRAIVRNQTGKK